MYSKLGEHEKVVADCDKALSLSPGSSFLLFPIVTQNKRCSKLLYVEVPH